MWGTTSLGEDAAKGEGMGTALRIGLITAYLAEDWHSQQLCEAAQRVGAVEIIRPEEFAARLTPGGVALHLPARDLTALDGFILARGFGDRGNSDFLVPVYQLLAQQGGVVVNDIDAVLLALDKFATSWRLRVAGIPTPTVAVVQEAALGASILAQWGRLVAKPLFGSLGMGIELLEDTRAGRALLPVLLERFGALYLQEYIPTPGRDIRAFVVGAGVPASIYRVAAPGEWRTNIHQGGTARPCTLDPATTAVAVAAARVIGLDYTGVDILEGADGPMVIEVNGTPLWRGVLEATGRNMADEILARVVARIAHARGAEGGRGPRRQTAARDRAAQHPAGGG